MPSFILEQLEQMKEGEDMEELKAAAATMFGAGEATVLFFSQIYMNRCLIGPF
jgi:hypothetical protein